MTEEASAEASAGEASAEARLIHAGTRRDLGAPATPPLVPASVYASWGEPDPARAYGRTGNPSWEALEEALGVLEDADAVVFSSGQAAAMALLLALAEGRRRVLLPEDGYYNIRVLADWLRPTGRRRCSSTCSTWAPSSASSARGRPCCGPRPRPTRCCGWPT